MGEFVRRILKEETSSMNLLPSSFFPTLPIPLQDNLHSFFSIPTLQIVIRQLLSFFSPPSFFSLPTLQQPPALKDDITHQDQTHLEEAKKLITTSPKIKYKLIDSMRLLCAILIEEGEHESFLL